MRWRLVLLAAAVTAGSPACSCDSFVTGGPDDGGEGSCGNIRCPPRSECRGGVCVSVEGSDAGRDAAFGIDSGLEAGVDAAADAGGFADAGLDAGWDADNLVDAQVTDTGIDAPPDSGDDTGTNDLDSGVGADAGEDSGPPCDDPRCADCTVEHTYASGMIGCNGAQTQCGASALCGAGLHICSYVEYRAMGGADGMSNAPRWLASCNRRICAGRPEDDIIGPSNEVCGTCTGEVGDGRRVSWVCGGGADPSLVDCEIGNFADGVSRHIVSEALECIWAGAASTSTEMGATCSP